MSGDKVSRSKTSPTWRWVIS